MEPDENHAIDLEILDQERAVACDEMARPVIDELDDERRREIDAAECAVERELAALERELQ
jgi:hypothetical protein